MYKFEAPKPDGGTQKVYIRDDAGGPFFADDSSQNRGPHFNDEKGNPYGY
ncbi:HNH/endonuclease VII fold putative polymorphic toxin [Dryocola sp. BD613]